MKTVYIVRNDRHAQILEENLVQNKIKNYMRPWR